MSRLCFDTTALLLMAKAGLLDDFDALLGPCVVPEYILDVEVAPHVGRYPENQGIIDADWLVSVPSHDDDAQFVAQLLKRWGSGSNRDGGEAEVIASARRYGYVAVLEDETGRAAAIGLGIPTAYTVSILLAAAACSSIKPKRAWGLHRELEACRDGFHVLTGSDVHREVFETAFKATWRLRKTTGADSIAELLATGKVDDIVLAALKRRH